jgi:hypothetical protein
MQHHNDVSTMQDTSTQAMTEVALGLSMAFFALLIIALMSVALPSKTQTDNASQVNKISATIDVSNQIELSIQDSTQNNQTSSKRSNINAEDSQQQTVLLFWEGQFYDTQQHVVSINQIMANTELVVAVSPQIPFNQLIDIQKQFAGKQMRLTTLTTQWQTSLSEGALGAL